MTDQPREGVCMKCWRRLPLFRFSCDRMSDEEHILWLCTRDWSTAQLANEAGELACVKLGIDRNAAPDPFVVPPRTALERAFAAGPIAGPIRSYGPTGAQS